MNLQDINIHAFRMINDLGKEFTFLNFPMVVIANYFVVLLALIIILYWFTKSKKNKIMILSAAVAFILAEIIGDLAGKLHQNHQPFAELANVNQLIEKAVDNSFPSDHTILFFSFCVTFWLFKRGWSFLWILLACLVGISRIWVGVHYPFDVLVGAMISIFTAWIAYRIVPRLRITHYILNVYTKVEDKIFLRRKSYISKDD